MIGAGAAVVIHGVAPFLFQSTGSRTIRRLSAAIDNRSKSGVHASSDNDARTCGVTINRALADVHQLVAARSDTIGVSDNEMRLDIKSGAALRKTRHATSWSA
jgi:hypothetical protein